MVDVDGPCVSLNIQPQASTGPRVQITLCIIHYPGIYVCSYKTDVMSLCSVYSC